MRLEIRGSKDKLRRLKMQLQEQFAGIGLHDGFHEVLVVTYFATVASADPIISYVRAFADGAGLSVRSDSQ